MKTLIATLAAIAALVGAPTAQADANSYLSRLAAADYNAYEAQGEWMTIGYWVCNESRSGTSYSAMAREIVANTGIGIWNEDAYEIIGIAQDELCAAYNQREDRNRRLV